MPHPTTSPQARQLETLRTQFAQADGLPFADVLTAERLERALDEEKATWREVIYTPALTLWAFLSPILSADGSCRATVARGRAWLVSRGEQPCSPKTAPYCKARQRLPEPLFRRLVRATGQELHRQSLPAWRWLGRPVKVADGTTVAMLRPPPRPTAGSRRARGRLAQAPRPAWMDEAAYQALPEELELRAVRVRVRQRGFRTKVLVVVTTLCDATT